VGLCGRMRRRLPQGVFNHVVAAMLLALGVYALGQGWAAAG